jgi:hypothetical protein
MRIDEQKIRKFYAHSDNVNELVERVENFK